MLKATISVEACDEMLAESVRRALEVEAENPPDPQRGEARVERRGTKILVHIKARDYASARALINAYLRLLASLLDTLGRLENV